MFEIGECILYGVNGICRVENIGPSPYDKQDTRNFYFLIPINNPMNSTICTPVNNERVPMRRLMTPEEIKSLIAKLPHILPLTVAYEKKRREIYRNAIDSLHPEELIQVIKTVEERRLTLEAARKKLPLTDMEFERLAKHLLYSECAIVLGKKESEMEEYIFS